MKSYAALGALTLFLAFNTSAGNDNLDLARERAAKYLISQHQGDGLFGRAQAAEMPGVTAIVIRALANHSDSYRPAKNDAIKKGAEYLLKCQDKTGAIYLKEFGIENLNTCVALSALKLLDDPAYADAARRAQEYVLSCQSVTLIGTEPDRHGAFSEGKEANFNLMSTSMSLEALHEAGLDPSSPVWKNAAAFVRRCQDHTELNTARSMQGGESTGAFVYYPGFSEHGTTRTRAGRNAPTPYGSMTYEALKSLVYCGTDSNDPAIQAAMKWMLQTYSPAENPGAVRNQAYFYYALSFAKAFSAMKKKEVVLTDGRTVFWAKDLSLHLMSLQRADGSFLNTEPRWMEDSPVVCTAFALEALTLCAKAQQ